MPDSIRAFLLKRLFSFLGIVPLGIYVILHLYNNAYSTQGPEAYNLYLQSSRQVPYYFLLVFLFIYLPLIFHGIYGLVLTRRGKMNYPQYAWFRNLKYVLQRLSGLGLILFIPAHVYKTKLAPALYGFQMDYRHMSEGMHESITLTVYILGILAVAFHLANGIWSAGITWGVTLGPKSQRVSEILSIFIFGVIVIMGFNAIRGFF
jgi:succinate dehydrogenase / fumarate reductase cytochrome b subunit